MPLSCRLGIPGVLHAGHLSPGSGVTASWCPSEHLQGLSTPPFLLLLRELLPVEARTGVGGRGCVSREEGERDRREGRCVADGPQPAAQL